MKIYGKRQNQPQQQSSPTVTRSIAMPPAASQVVHPLMHLQRTIGNRAVQRMLRASLPHPVLQRVPQQTWGGTFDTVKYDLLPPERKRDGRDVYGADIEITFEPNDKVDAEKIALVQTAQSLRDGMPVSVYAGHQNDVTPGRRIPDYQPGQGTGIDARPEKRTPLYGMTDPTTGNELADSGESKIMQLGHRRPGALPQKAKIGDRPGLSVPVSLQGSQHFETTALAIAGPQKGAYYGSVEWGWEKNPNETTHTQIKFARVSNDAPGAEFKEAAKLWNDSKTSEGKETIDLPITRGQYTNIKTGQLMDKPGKGKSLGTLDLNTRLEVTEQTDPKFPGWGNVIVVGDGPLTGKVGWVQNGILSSSITPELKPKKPKK